MSASEHSQTLGAPWHRRWRWTLSALGLGFLLSACVWTKASGVFFSLAALAVVLAQTSQFLSTAWSTRLWRRPQPQTVHAGVMRAQGAWPVFWAMTSYCWFTTVVMLLTHSPTRTAELTLSLLVWVGVAYAYRDAVTAGAERAALMQIWRLGLPAAALGLYLAAGSALWQVLKLGWERAQADSNAVVFGNAVCFAATFLAWGWFRRRALPRANTGVWDLGVVLALLAALLALLLSGTRNALVQWVLAVMAFGLGAWKVRRSQGLTRSRWQALIVGGGVVVVLVLGVKLLGGRLVASTVDEIHLMSTTATATAPTEVEAQRAWNTSTAQRWEMWKFSWRSWQTAPWLGHGAGTWRVLFQQSPAAQARPDIFGHFVASHNAWLTVAVERGLLGVAIFSVSLLTPVVFFARRLRSGPGDRWVAGLGLALAVQFVLMNTINDAWAHQALMRLYVVLLGGTWWAYYVSVRVAASASDGGQVNTPAELTASNKDAYDSLV